MNHRQGRLLAQDLEPAFEEPAPKFFHGPVEIESDFAQYRPGATFNDPAIGQGRPSDTAWRISNAINLCLLIGTLSMMLKPVSGYVLAMLERVLP